MHRQKLVLVTGATGFVGRHLALALLRQGCRVRLFVRSFERLAPPLREMCEIVVGDLCDKDAALQAADEVSQVFHCAANVSTWDDEDAYYRVNTSGTQVLLDALIERRCALTRFVHVSTLDVYGFPEASCNESSPVRSEFGYGRSKIAGESVVKTTCERFDVPYTILRPGNVIGPGSPFVERVGDALDRGLMLLVDGGRVHAGLVSVNNLVNVLIWSAAAPEAANACFNVRDATEMDWRTFVYRLKAGIGGRGLVISVPYGLALLSAHLLQKVHVRLFKTGEPLWHPLLVSIFGRTCGHNIEKLQVARGSSESISIEEALGQSIEWYKTRANAHRSQAFQ